MAFAPIKTGALDVTSRSRIVREARTMGLQGDHSSLHAPEQALGAEVSARADPHSLGAILYETVSGRPLFLGYALVATIGQRINTPPVAPTSHNPRYSRPFEAVILRLLANDLAKRGLSLPPTCWSPWRQSTSMM